MSYQTGLLVIATLLCVSIYTVSSLQCYECSSLLDKNCGVTWGYEVDGGEGDTYLTTCIGGDNVACRKLEYEHHTGRIVTRSCWNTTKPELARPKLQCNKMLHGNVCYCANDEPCNGKQLLKPQVVLLFGLATLLYILFR